MMAAQPATDGKRVLCAGRLYCDLVMGGLSAPPAAGQEVYADSLVLAAGGGAYITAAYLAALGRGAGLAAVLPAEPFAGPIATELASSGVDLSACGSAPAGLDPQITVALVTGGDRAFVTRRAGASLPPGLGDFIRGAGFQHLHFGELASLAEAPEVLRAAKEAGMTVSCDCAWDAALLSRPDLVQMLRGVDVFLPNRVEAEALQRHAALADYAPLVIVKDGANGAEAISAAGRLHRPALPVKVVDTIGAGDAFNAGFLDSWLDGASLPDCLDAGACVAGSALSRQGGARGLERLARFRPAAE